MALPPIVGVTIGRTMREGFIADASADDLAAE